MVMLMAAAVCCCDDDGTDGIPVLPVIEGWIDSDGYPVVMFTASVTSDEAAASLIDKMIVWGKVTISDGSRTVVMTGSLADGYFPPYRYYTFDMKGEPGRTYTVVADYAELHAEASCRMPFPTEISSLRLAAIEGNDSLRTATLSFMAPEDCPAYYCVTVRDLLEKTRPYPAMMGTVVAETPGEEIEMPVYCPKNMLDTASYVSNFHVGSRLEVGLSRVEEPVYRFWTDYDNAVMFGGSQFINASMSLRGNIQGGYGIWSARGTSYVYVDVE